jgi:hypothetical protein
MSELKVDKVSPRSGTYVSLNTVGSKNIFINGDMSIAQRGTSFTGLGNGGSAYTVDRFKWTEEGTITNEWTITQDTDVPTGQGFATSLKVDCTTADASLDANSIQYLEQRVEGQNLQYLKYGTANAESLTLSFWVKSNKTGTYTINLVNTDAATRYSSQTYTILASNTWEKKTLVFSGDTSSGFDNDNGNSFSVQINLAAGTNKSSGSPQTWNTSVEANRAPGQVNLADDTANDFYITGVQLEAGTTASDFEFLPYDVNLGRCMRYYEKLIMSDVAAVGYSNSASNAITVMTSSYIKRTSPSLTIPPAGNGAGQISFLTNAGVYPSTFGSIAVFDTNITSFSLNQTGMTGAYSGAGLGVALYGADGESIGIDAEL